MFNVQTVTNNRIYSQQKYKKRMSYLIEEREIGDYRIKVYQDEDAKCPCLDWDMAALYLWESDTRSYYHQLSGYCNWKEVLGPYSSLNHSLTEALRDVACENIDFDDLVDYFKNGKIKGYLLRFDEDEELWVLECEDSKHKKMQELYSYTSSELENCSYMDEFIETLEDEELIWIINKLGRDIFIKEWSSRGYCQGHYTEGVAICTKERYIKIVSEDTTDWKEKIDKLIDSEVETIGMWMWGDVKGYVLEKKVPYKKVYEDEGREDEECCDWEDIDSCGGFYMETEELIDEVIAEHELKETEQ